MKFHVRSSFLFFSRGFIFNINIEITCFSFIFFKRDVLWNWSSSESVSSLIVHTHLVWLNDPLIITHAPALHEVSQ